MSIQDMERVAFDQVNPNSGAVYHNKVAIDSGSESDPYMLPDLEVYAIAVWIDGDGALEFTNDPRSVVEADTADWEEWNGTDAINSAVTAFRVTRNSGTVTGKVTVRTAEA